MKTPLASADPDHRLSHEEKLKQLYLEQKHTLDLFLERGAVSRQQYSKSLGDLAKKMGLEKEAQR